MPIIQRLGSASTRGFGQFGGGGYWIAKLSSLISSPGIRNIAVDSSGNVYVAGLDGSNILIAKYSSSGIIQWQRSLSVGTDYGEGVAVDSSGNVYVTGVSNSQLILAKYDTYGVIQWQRSLSGASCYGYATTVNSSGVYVTGYSNASGNLDILTAKYDTSGAIQWQYILGSTSSSSDIGRGIAVDSSGNVYVSTRSTFNTGSYDLVLAKYSSSGALQWQRGLYNASTSAEDSGWGIAVDSSNNVYVTGYFDDGSSFNLILAKYNSSGAIQWQRSLSSANSDQGRGIAVDSSGNVYVAGISSGNMLLAKYNSSGAIQWQRSLSGISGYGVAVDSSGNVYAAGSASSGIILAKLPGDGSLTGTYTVGGTNITYAVSTLTDAAGTLTAATSTLTAATSTLTSATSTLTDAASSLTSTVTRI